MPYWYTSQSHPEARIYVGFDKHENETLLRAAWPEDVWFHVDKHSSAHVYLRCPSDDPLALHAGQTPSWAFPNIPNALLEELSQLTKENSIEGSKLPHVTVIFTPASNLHKDGSMDVGTVGFKKDSLVRRYHVKERDKALLKALQKTRVEDSTTDLLAEHQKHLSWLQRQQKAVQKLVEKASKAQEDERRALKRARDYTDAWSVRTHDRNDSPVNDTKEPESNANPFDDFM
ncbi:hypothetical protein GMRT_11016 [Giardia muris]|uniref:NFACT RNA-binding domain-containing protein n=1 Tax=Giardia muris TaxID=5742 RepID=A0A4Z1T809_GIAMU|nr:hypothetical protein GMRT_11016 [Giardia muris]|eukprot:TNJ29297.1 hypothetical protein GMRT_11016 [Giardia muris]